MSFYNGNSGAFQLQTEYATSNALLFGALREQTPSANNARYTAFQTSTEYRQDRQLPDGSRLGDIIGTKPQELTVRSPAPVPGNRQVRVDTNPGFYSHSRRASGFEDPVKEKSYAFVSRAGFGDQI